MAPARKVGGGSGHNLLGFWRLDPTSQVVHADERVCAAFGVAPEEGHARTALSRFAAKIHPEDPEPFAASLREAYENGTTFAPTYRIVDGHPEPQPVSGLGRAFHGQGEVTRYYADALFEARPAKPQGHARIDMVNHLIAALDLARELDEDILSRLIEAVLLEAGRRLAANHREDAGRNRLNASMCVDVALHRGWRVPARGGCGLRGEGAEGPRGSRAF
ncbi:PAS domain-containing protein [Antarcticirhabdus aurantiaca]